MNIWRYVEVTHENESIKLGPKSTFNFTFAELEDEIKASFPDVVSRTNTLRITYKTSQNCTIRITTDIGLTMAMAQNLAQPLNLLLNVSKTLATNSSMAISPEENAFPISTSNINTPISASKSSSITFSSTCTSGTLPFPPKYAAMSISRPVTTSTTSTQSGIMTQKFPSPSPVNNTPIIPIPIKPSTQVLTSSTQLTPKIRLQVQQLLSTSTILDLQLAHYLSLKMEFRSKSLSMKSNLQTAPKSDLVQTDSKSSVNNPVDLVTNPEETDAKNVSKEVQAVLRNQLLAEMSLMGLLFENGVQQTSMIKCDLNANKTTIQGLELLQKVNLSLTAASTSMLNYINLTTTSTSVNDQMLTQQNPLSKKLSVESPKQLSTPATEEILPRPINQSTSFVDQELVNSSPMRQDLTVMAPLPTSMSTSTLTPGLTTQTQKYKHERPMGNGRYGVIEDEDDDANENSEMDIDKNKDEDNDYDHLDDLHP